jgi:hypothetical protein
MRLIKAVMDFLTGKNIPLPISRPEHDFMNIHDLAALG